MSSSHVPHDKGHGSDLGLLWGGASDYKDTAAKHAGRFSSSDAQETKSLKSGYSGSNLRLLKG